VLGATVDIDDDTDNCKKWQRMLTLGKNIASLNAQRSIANSQNRLSTVFERLSSGQRINRASDDAAGLAIADGLRVKQRVYAQGVRNLNDGLSALQIADSAISQLSQIVTRIRELAQQSASGAISVTQRKAIDREAQELRDEYFRVSRETSFNRLKLFDGSLNGGLSIQGRYGINGSIQSSLGGIMGDGTFASPMATGSGLGAISVAVGDLNGDGFQDLVTANYYSTTVSVMLGNGAGTFQAARTFMAGSMPHSVALGDVNGDGVLDITTANWGASDVGVLIGRGDGTFQAGVTYNVEGAPTAVAMGDLNGDGHLDVVATSDGTSTAGILINNGDGTFQTVRTVSTGLGPYSLSLGDLNGDGVLDMVTAGASTAVSVHLGNGDGTFRAPKSYDAPDVGYGVDIGDINGDGILDIVSANYGTHNVSIFAGRGDGTFQNAQNISAGNNPQAVTLGDFNGDGALDIATASFQNSVSVIINNGNGTFISPQIIGVGFNPSGVATADVNSDGVLDLVSANRGSNDTSVLLGDAREGVAPLLPFSLATLADARQALAPLDQKLSQLSAQRGTIGAFQSRLGIAFNTLQRFQETHQAAESRIRDADLALEAADLTRGQIIQQAATAVLAQANAQPALVIQLLQP